MRWFDEMERIDDSKAKYKVLTPDTYLIWEFWVALFGDTLAGKFQAWYNITTCWESPVMLF